MGGSADPPRINQVEARDIAAEVAAESAGREILRVRDEEWTLLAKGRLEDGQVDDRGIYLHLPEIRIDCRVEREIRCEVHLEVPAGAIDHLVGRVIGITGPHAFELAARRRVWDDLDLARLRVELDSFEGAEISGTTVFVVPPECPHVLLVAAIDFAPDLHSPHLVGRARKAQLGEGNSKFGGPTQRIDFAGTLPNRIVRWISVLMVAFHAIGIELEPVATVLVAEGVEHECNAVRRQVIAAVHDLVAPRQRRTNTLGAERVVHAGADVEGACIVKDADIGFLTGRLAFVGR